MFRRRVFRTCFLFVFQRVAMFQPYIMCIAQTEKGSSLCCDRFVCCDVLLTTDRGEHSCEEVKFFPRNGRLRQGQGHTQYLAE